MSANQQRVRISCSIGWEMHGYYCYLLSICSGQYNHGLSNSLHSDTSAHRYASTAEAERHIGVRFRWVLQSLFYVNRATLTVIPGLGIFTIVVDVIRVAYLQQAQLSRLEENQRSAGRLAQQTDFPCMYKANNLT
jgi:hypothetical protein